MFSSTLRVFGAVAFGLAAAGALTGAGDESGAKPPAGRTRDVQRAPLVGQEPPELVAARADWLAGPPTTLAALRGKVVWLQFNF